MKNTYTRYPAAYGDTDRGNAMELYIHIPFCIRKCGYCDFLSFPCQGGEKKAYLQALHKEILCCHKDGGSTPVTSVFFGGGTPSLLSGEELTGILSSLRQQFVFAKDAEITMEANPGTLSRENLRLYRAAGVNRLSIGCQSVHDTELKMLGRIHTFAQFTESFSLAREAGFSNINVDLMSAIPGQDLASWRDCLEAVTALSPEHISAYSLIIEEGTPFFEMQDTLMLPDEDTEREMYALTREFLAKKGYIQYEISNYALSGRECRHNIGYWDQTPYLGLGLGASSYKEGVRWKNTSDMKSYLSQADTGQLVRVDEERLSVDEQMEEFMFLGLRMNRGVSISLFQERFGMDMMAVYQTPIEHFVREKLLTICQNRVCLTEKGMDLADMVMAEFMLS